ncbi:group III truncated hemoglobin [Endozoicomonas arenosclerae]|uniref:group III truncated hemoglobin n=1 Tax=Endozoicomonas arenosclerae TaxID=1633495 RepID=UPI0012946B0E|nr:group III truncated hemoglobin [Endozoicomonas arenosclerae]
MKDIETPQDVHQLISEFYQHIRDDAVLGPIFDEVAEVDWPNHLPVMFTFWESLLLRTEHYRGNALQPHLNLFQKIPFEPAFMSQWLSIFKSTVDELFAGEVAERAKHFAEGIAHNLDRQITRRVPLMTEGVELEKRTGRVERQR